MFRINEKIQVKQVRLVAADGSQVGVVTIEEARAAALQALLDLVEVSPTSNPPVCRLMDFGKFKYELRKKSQQQHKKQHVQKLKEIRLRPITEEHDVMVKVNHAKQFLEHGDKVLFTMVFRGREGAHKEIGRALLTKITEELILLGKVERPVTQDGPRLSLTLMPKHQ